MKVVTTQSVLQTTKYEIINDEFLEEIALNAILAEDKDDFIGYASRISQFHHYVASMALELQQYRRGIRDISTRSNIVEKAQTIKES